MKFNGFIGPTYSLNSRNVDDERCVNLIPEVIEGTGKEGQNLYFKSREGLRKLYEFNNPVRGMIAYSYLGIFIATGNQIWVVKYVDDEVMSGSPGWNFRLNGNINTSSGDVSFAAISTDIYTDSQLVCVDGSSEIYSINFIGVTAYSPGFNATHVVALDNYYIYIVPDENKFYVSDIASIYVNALSFTTPEGNKDKIVTAIVNNRELWIFNENSIEIFVNTGNADFPFERASNGYINKGTIAKKSVARIENIIFWLGNDEYGGMQIFAASGAQAQRISTFAIEQRIAKTQNQKNATAFTYQNEGHSYYVINFDDFTLCYDLTTKLWHERATTSEEGLKRYKLNHLVYHSMTGNGWQYANTFSKFVGADFENGNIYELDQNYRYDDQTLITAMRRTPHLSAQLKNLFINSIQFDIQTASITPENSFYYDENLNLVERDPKVVFRFSIDGGYTWSNEKYSSLGKIGEYKKRVLFWRLGLSRDFVFEIKIVEPIDVTILSCEFDAEAGTN